jgi:hypothetical protein
MSLRSDQAFGPVPILYLSGRCRLAIAGAPPCASVLSISRWRPDVRDADEEPREVDSYAGVARKP